MTDIRAITRARRAKMLQMRRGTIGFAQAQLSLKREVVHAICEGIYGHGHCACARALDKPVCERVEGAAQHVIDLVRNHDARARDNLAGGE